MLVCVLDMQHNRGAGGGTPHPVQHKDIPIAGLVPATHVSLRKLRLRQDVDARVKPGQGALGGKVSKANADFDQIGAVIASRALRGEAISVHRALRGLRLLRCRSQ
jgi:hypothetical protein